MNGLRKECKRIAKQLRNLRKTVDEMNERHLPWPNIAKEDRDLCAEDANSIIRTLDPFFQDIQMTPEQTIKQISRVYAYAHNIRARLKKQGAQIEF